MPECIEALQEQIILAIAQMNLYLSDTAPLTDHIALHLLAAHASESTLLLIIIAEVTNLFIWGAYVVNFAVCQNDEDTKCWLTFYNWMK